MILEPSLKSLFTCSCVRSCPLYMAQRYQKSFPNNFWVWWKHTSPSTLVSTVPINWSTWTKIEKYPINETRHPHTCHRNRGLHTPQPRTKLQCYPFSDLDTAGIIYSDQTGNFPCISRKVNNVFLLCTVWAPMTYYPNLLKADQRQNLPPSTPQSKKKLVKCGLKPQLHHLDNEYPKSLKIFITEVDEIFQLMPPHFLQVNVSERVIHMWRNHFMAGACSIDPDLPIHLWFRLIQHSDITFNMLRPFIMNPKLLAYEWQGGGVFSTYIPWCLLVEK